MIIRDLSGRTVYNQQLKLQAGTNKFQLPTSLGSGSYFLSIENANQRETQQFIVIK